MSRLSHVKVYAQANAITDEHEHLSTSDRIPLYHTNKMGFKLTLTQYGSKQAQSALVQDNFTHCSVSATL